MFFAISAYGALADIPPLLSYKTQPLDDISTCEPVIQQIYGPEAG
jgi:hypothetical protein